MKSLLKSILSIPHQAKKWHVEMALVSGLIVSCAGAGGEKPLHFQQIEKKVYDIPAKSQVTCQVYLTDTVYTHEELTRLTDSLAIDCQSEPVKWHKSPTHVFVYVYAKQGDYEADGSNWIAMYHKDREKDYGVQLKNR